MSKLSFYDNSELMFSRISNKEIQTGHIDYNGSDEFVVIDVKKTGEISITLNVQNNLASKDSTVYLQVFDKDTDTWETKDYNNTSIANEKFSLTTTLSPKVELLFKLYQEK